MKATYLIAALGACLIGCAHSNAPKKQVASAMAAVRAAQEAGAASVPEAELHLQLATEQLSKAKQLIAHDHNAEGEDKALRARNDAELALSLTHERALRNEYEQFREGASSDGVAP